MRERERAREREGKRGRGRKRERERAMQHRETDRDGDRGRDRQTEAVRETQRQRQMDCLNLRFQLLSRTWPSKTESHRQVHSSLRGTLQRRGRRCQSNSKSLLADTDVSGHLLWRLCKPDDLARCGSGLRQAPRRPGCHLAWQVWKGCSWGTL